VVISDQQGGNVQFAITGSLGFYTFDNVPAGGPYTISVSSKRYTFNPMTTPVNENLSNLDLMAQPETGRSSKR
jgi:hypothetical protein